MREASQESSFARLANDTRQFFRSPGLVAVTTVAMSLILLFIVFPIGSVLKNSFTVGYPTVTITCTHRISDPALVERTLIDPLLRALTPVDGLLRHRVVKDGAQRFSIVLRFKKNWDDLKGANDAKRAIAPIREKIAPFIDRIRYGLGKERIYSTETYGDFFANSRYWHSLRNSIVLAVVSTTIIVIIGFCYAYMGLRGPKYARGPLRVLGLLPLVAPPLYLFTFTDSSRRKIRGHHQDAGA